MRFTSRRSDTWNDKHTRLFKKTICKAVGGSVKDIQTFMLIWEILLISKYDSLMWNKYIEVCLFVERAAVCKS